MSRINLYINSKHRKTDETTNNFNVNIPNNLLQVKSDEYLEYRLYHFIHTILFINVMIILICFRLYLEEMIIVYL